MTFYELFFEIFLDTQKNTNIPCNKFINLSLIRMNILKVGLYASTQHFRKCLGLTNMITQNSPMEQNVIICTCSKSRFHRNCDFMSNLYSPDLHVFHEISAMFFIITYRNVFTTWPLSPQMCIYDVHYDESKSIYGRSRSR